MRCIHEGCGAMLPPTAGITSCPNCDRNPFCCPKKCKCKPKSIEQIILEMQGEKVKRIITKKDDIKERLRSEQMLRELKKKLE